jgi:hypothetical protein
LRNDYLVDLNKTPLNQVPMGRKPVLWVDNNSDSIRAIQLLNENGIEYVDHKISEFEDGCCGGPHTTKAPVLFAFEGIFRDLDGILNYISEIKQKGSKPSESAYW